MVLVDVKPSGLKAKAKIQWTTAQIIGSLLVAFSAREDSFWNRDMLRGNFNQILLCILSLNFGVSRIV